jgi:hypothetical protein
MRRIIMNFGSINYLAVLVAALASFVLGGAWYSKVLFGKTWMKENGFTEDELSTAKMGRIFAGAFLLALIGAFYLSAFLAGSTTLLKGVTYGAIVGIGWVATSIGIVYLFERKSLILYIINAGYLALNLMLMGAIISLWK